ncbi:protein kinase domain-containing protein [Oligoflexus tunisiensis]|uniref:protein kinase domain-containing protein n=1 Tax=Oligoflexus tunisiensis TaxID=708132 RepID=UPI00114CF7EB|nr:protein kinase [Oligoflexus tunisiensis]
MEYVSWFAAPIRDKSGRILAGLALSVNTSGSFDRIIKVGRWGESGETYAFNRQGFMVSESRFNDQLVAAGLLNKGQPAGLNIALKDPGGNLTEGFRPKNYREDWPFTRIVSKALERPREYSDEMQGHVLEPYRDYRGMEVVGAWRWHPSLLFGLITEVDAGEAFVTLRFADTLYMAMIILCGTASLFAALNYFAMIRMRPAARLGDRMGQYRLLRKIAEGGIGEIYLARHEFLKRPAAIKILKKDRDKPDSLNRFEAEVRATCKLTHPNTVAVYDFGRTVDECFYYVMEYLQGISLARLIEVETRMPWRRAIHLLLQICGSLKEAHALGLIHRDIKPLNIMVCRLGGVYDFVKVVDFGLVKSIKSLVPSETTDSLSSQLRGTPGYIAPELLIQPLAANERSDIYSLGVVAYKMLSGCNLFDATHEAGLLYDVLHTTPRNLAEHRPDLPPALVRLIMMCVEKNPLHRPPNMETLESELRASADAGVWTQNEAKQWWSLRDHLLLLPG